MRRIPSLLVAAEGALRSEGGGVQVAWKDYRAVLQVAGFDFTLVPFQLRASLLSRVWNRLVPKVMLVKMPDGLVRRVAQIIEEVQPQFVFFFPTAFPEVVRHIRQNYPKVRQVLLSVGVESIDFCIAQQIRAREKAEDRPSRRAYRMLGQQLLEEAEIRSLLDFVLTMSPLEEEVEKWLGAPRVKWLPRTIMEEPLSRHPVDGRVGCVSTLNHPPNLDGLMQVLHHLAPLVPSNLRFRLVGRPEKEGGRLAARFPFVEYLGSLSDTELREEAATWCCFVHPLFVYAKGSSTKLAVALGWGLPVVTTAAGARGYFWDESIIALARTPGQLAEQVVACAQVKSREISAANVRKIVDRTPTVEAIGADVHQFLLLERGLETPRPVPSHFD